MGWEVLWKITVQLEQQQHELVAGSALSKGC
jgi:hypothetical protein